MWKRAGTRDLLRVASGTEGSALAEHADPCRRERARARLNAPLGEQRGILISPLDDSLRFS